MICGDGTVFDAATGACVPDPTACAEGTVLVNGQCVPNDENLTADAEEAAEPNGLNADDGFAGNITLGGEIDDGFVIHGCVNPFEDKLDADGQPNPDGQNDVDYDAWTLQVNEPTLIEVTADGVGGLAAGFLVLPGDAQLNTDGWQRFGVNLSNDTSKRQVFLPKAGVYVLAMTDSRSLFLDAAGSPTACYYTTIRQLPLPTPMPIVAGVTSGAFGGGEVKFYAYDPAEGDIVDGLEDSATVPVLDSLVLLRNDTYVMSAAEGADFFGPLPAQAFAGGLADTDTLLVVADFVYDYALGSSPYNLTLNVGAAKALPTAGSVALTNVSETVTSIGDLTFAYFDVANDGDVVHFDLEFSSPTNLVLFDSDIFVVATIDDIGEDGVTEWQDWVHFPKAGRYYLVTHDRTTPEQPAELTITSAWTAVTPTTLAVGTPVADAALSPLGASWFELDPAASFWLAFSAGASDFGDAVKVDFYDQTVRGRPDLDFAKKFGFTFLADGSQTAGRIGFGETTKYLVRVTDAATSLTSPTFDLSVAARDFTDLGTVTPAMPQSRTGETVAAGARKLYFVRGVAPDGVTIQVTGTGGFDPIMQRLGTTEGILATLNASGVDGTETLSVAIGTVTFIAFAVSGDGASGGTYDVAITAVTPKPFTVTTGALPLVDACADGTELAQHEDATVNGFLGDEAFADPQTLPFAFSLYGDSVSTFHVSTNGWVSFAATEPVAADFSNDPIPSALGANGVVAPYWDDLEGIVMCRKDTAGAVTLQWTGKVFGTTGPAVSFQVVFHDTGVIDFIYGSAQAANGSSASVGAENTAGLFGQQLVFNMASTILPSTSRTLTPAP